MTTGNTFARLKYLENSAHLLALTAPTVSTQLGFEYIKLATEGELNLPDASRRNRCGACGTALIPGLTCHVYSERKGSRKEAVQTPHDSVVGGASDKPAQKPSCLMATGIVYECHRCDRKSSFDVAATPRMKSPRRCINDMAPMTSRAANTGFGLEGNNTGPPLTLRPSEPIATSSSGRRRAKARRQGGLQAALDQKHAQEKRLGASTGYALDLMDLMNKD